MLCSVELTVMASVTRWPGLLSRTTGLPVSYLIILLIGNHVFTCWQQSLLGTDDAEAEAMKVVIIIAEVVELSFQPAIAVEFIFNSNA